MIVKEELTDEQLADMVRLEWDQLPNEMIGRPGYQMNKRIDKAILAVAKQTGLRWRVVLKAYRVKYPLQ
jgi:hypothetical protein